MKLTKVAAAVIIAAISSVSGLAVTIQTSSDGLIKVTDALVGGSGDVDNVLFNSVDGTPGTTVHGTINQGAFLATITSPFAVQVSGGQASLTDPDLTTPFTRFTFSLENATFTKAQLNPDLVSDGTLRFVINYINGNGQFQTTTFIGNGNGQNFFTIEAFPAARITDVTLISSVVLADTNQIRIGGAAPLSVPDGGSTLMFMGLAMAGFGSLRRYITA